jgi:hypothetical protein
MSKKFDRVEYIKQELNKKKEKLSNDFQELQNIKNKIMPNVNSSDLELNTI